MVRSHPAPLEEKVGGRSAIPSGRLRSVRFSPTGSFSGAAKTTEVWVRARALLGMGSLLVGTLVLAGGSGASGGLGATTLYDASTPGFAQSAVTVPDGICAVTVTAVGGS